MNVNDAPRPPARMGPLQLVAATYFMVAGGPYGLEDLIARSGYAKAIAVLIITPIVWSLPTALLVGELSAALPEDGGFYIWVRRALGPFWAFQEAWLSLAASAFDMAIYPTLFCLYLARLWPPAARPPVALAIGIGLIATCTALNIRGVRAVGRASIALAFALVSPFVALIIAGALSTAPPQPLAPPSGGLLAGVLVAMWNYMGWDNASTIAGEVARPERTYPRVMLATVALVALTYIAPVLAVAHAGIDASQWAAGSWADAGRTLGGSTLAIAVVVGGMVSSAGMFNALVLSYSRLPRALADDRLLPAIFGRTRARTGAPVASLVACSVAYAACLGLGFERLVELDVALYGLALLLEFVALFALRLREPDLPRPFRVPGGLIGVGLLAVAPIALLGAALADGRNDQSGGVKALYLALSLVALGPLLYKLCSTFMRPRGISEST